MNKIQRSINVLVVCYKQQNVIKRALDSVLNQKEFGLNKIIVCDDCSPDETWKVLQEYKTQYSEYIDIYRNEHNLGIYQNMMKLLSLRGNADLYVSLSGDDAFGIGYFKAIQEFLCSTNVDFSKAIGIYSDFTCITPNGQSLVHVQDMVKNKNINLISLYLRQKICCRSLIVNDVLLSRHEGTVLDKGLALAEWLFELNKIKELEVVYYVPVVGDIYYKGIGISTKLLDSEYYSSEAIVKWTYLKKAFIKTSRDNCLANAEIYKARFLKNPKLCYFIMAAFYYLNSGYPQKVSFGDLKSFLSLMKRRILRN